MSIVVAFSGGLDTSFCVPYLAETRGEPIITVTVDTGGLSAQDRRAIRQRALELGAQEHILVDARQDLFETQIQYLIKGNVLRGHVYPLCVGPDRVVQARHVVQVAREKGVACIAHGSTGAGNDQIRFDVALGVLARGMEIVTPIRDEGLTRADTTAFLKARGYDVPASTTTYSINTGMWGTTIGGRETLGTSQTIPQDAWPTTKNPAHAPDEAQSIDIGFKGGLPVSLDGIDLGPIDLVDAIASMGAAHGVGRAVHVGDTILGIKGRVAFEAPAAAILIPAHRELEKLVLTRWQRYHKDQLAEFYGMMVHEAQYFDPALRDIEALFDASQTHVTGSVTATLFKGHVSIDGASSPFSMFNDAVATYGETNALWDGRDARGFARILGVQSLLSPANQTTEASS